MSETNSTQPKWMQQLRYDKKGRLEETLTNARILVRNLPDFKGKLGYNPMTDSITVTGDLPWRKRRREQNRHQRLEALFDAGEERADRFTEWTERDWPDFYAYMETYGFMTGKRKENGMLDNAVLSVAQEQTCHPIKR